MGLPPSAGRARRDAERLGQASAPTTRVTIISRAPRWARACTPRCRCWSPKSSSVDLARIKVEIAPPGERLQQRAARRPDHRRLDLGARRLGEAAHGRRAGARRCWWPPRRSEWSVDAVDACRAENGVVIGAGGQEGDATASSPRRRRSCRCRRTSTLKDPSEFTLVGKRAKRLDTPSKVNGTRRVRHRRQAARHAVRGAGAVPGDRRQGGELRRRQGEGMPGVMDVVQITRRRGRGRRQLVAREQGARRARRSSGTRARTPRSSSRRSVAAALQAAAAKPGARHHASTATRTRRCKAAAKHGRGRVRAAAAVALRRWSR